MYCCFVSVIAVFFWSIDLMKFIYLITLVCHRRLWTSTNTWNLLPVVKVWKFVTRAVHWFIQYNGVTSSIVEVRIGIHLCSYCFFYYCWINFVLCISNKYSYNKNFCANVEKIHNTFTLLVKVLIFLLNLMELLVTV